MKLKPYTIYMWNDEKHVSAIAKAKNRLYFSGWDIEEDPKFKKDSIKRQLWRAKLYCTTQLDNTLNAIRLYGNKVLNKDGEIDEKKFHQEELFGARAAHMMKKKLSQEKPLRKHKVEEITFEQAQEFELV